MDQGRKERGKETKGKSDQTSNYWSGSAERALAKPEESYQKGENECMEPVVRFRPLVHVLVCVLFIQGIPSTSQASLGIRRSSKAGLTSRSIGLLTPALDNVLANLEAGSKQLYILELSYDDWRSGQTLCTQVKCKLMPWLAQE